MKAKGKLRALRTGFVSAFDIGLRIDGPRTIVRSRDKKSAGGRDAKALHGDWKKVGGDLAKATRKAG